MFARSPRFTHRTDRQQLRTGKLTRAKRTPSRRRVASFEHLEDRRLLAVSVQVSDPSVVEGNAGTTNLAFTVTRTGDVGVAFTADYRVAGDSATAAVTGPPVFTRRAIDAVVDDPQSVSAADIDGDGDPDALVAAYYDNTIAWYKNDGAGNFVKYAIATAGLAIDAAAADVDGDGDADVIAAWWNPDTLAWFENDGNENFTQRTIANLGQYAYGVQDVSTADVDGDGDVDILTADQGVDTFAWYENDGDGNFAAHIITSTADGARAVMAADLDGDLDVDVLAASCVDDTIAWYENDGNQNFAVHVIANDADFAADVSAADLDGDGDVDVLSASFTDKTIAWYENDGAASFTKRVLGNTLSGAVSVTAHDLDNDGDRDVLFAAEVNQFVGWYENQGALGFVQRVISQAGAYPNAAEAADFDGDGDLDVLTDFRTQDVVAWYENSLINPRPADFIAVAGTLEFAANEMQKTVVVTVFGDATLEGDEVLSLDVSIAGATRDRGYGTILNDELTPTKFYVVDDASANRTYEYRGTGASVENYALNSGNSAPRGAASTIVGDKVWVVDANRKVYVYSPSGALLGSWTAGTMASNATPEGIATNGTDVWIVDSKSDKVFRYAGAASRLSGSQNAASSMTLAGENSNPKDVATDGALLWVVNDSSTDKVFKYTVGGAWIGVWSIDAANKAPTGITLDPANSGNLWIVDSDTDRVYQYNGAASRLAGGTSASTSFALASGNKNPQGIADPPPATAALTSLASSATRRASAEMAAGMLTKPVTTPATSARHTATPGPETLQPANTPVRDQAFARLGQRSSFTPIRRLTLAAPPAGAEDPSPLESLDRAMAAIL